MAVLEIAIEPVGDSEHMSEAIAASIRALGALGVKEYQVTPMGTVIQGEVRWLLDLAAKMHEAASATGARRVVTTIRIDDRGGKGHRLAERVKAVEEKVGRAPA